MYIFKNKVDFLFEGPDSLGENCALAISGVPRYNPISSGSSTGRGGEPRIYFRKLPMARSTGERAKRAYIVRGPGPALGPWKLYHF